MLRTRCTVGVTVGLAASKQGRSSLGVSCRGYDFAVMRAPAHTTQPGVCPWAARSRTCEHIVRVWTRLAHSNLGPALPSVCPSAVDHHSFFSSQCRCGLGRSTRSRWHQPRRAVQPVRLLCSRSRFLALSMLPLFAPQGTWDGTVPCSARVGPASRWGRWAGCPGNVAPRFVLCGNPGRGDLPSTSRDGPQLQIAPGVHLALLPADHPRPGGTFPNVIPTCAVAPNRKASMGSPHPLLQSYPNSQPSSFPQDLHLPLHMWAPSTRGTGVPWYPAGTSGNQPSAK